MPPFQHENTITNEIFSLQHCRSLSLKKCIEAVKARNIKKGSRLWVAIFFWLRKDRLLFVYNPQFPYMAASCRLGRNHGETRSYLATSIGLSPLLAPHPSYPIKTCPSSNYQPQAPPKFSLCLKLRHELFTLQCATTQLIAFQSAPVLMKTTYLKQAVQ